MSEDKREEIREAADSWLDSCDWNGHHELLVEALVEFVERFTRPLEADLAAHEIVSAKIESEAQHNQDLLGELLTQREALQAENENLRSRVEADHRTIKEQAGKLGESYATRVSQEAEIAKLKEYVTAAEVFFLCAGINVDDVDIKAVHRLEAAREKLGLTTKPETPNPK